MRKLIAFIIACIMLLCASACAAPEAGDGLSIVTTVFPAYDFAREITGGASAVKLLLPPGTEAHSFEPTPQDIIAMQKCDLFIYAGGENEAWVTEVIEDIGLDKAKVISMLDVCEKLTEETVEGMQAEEEHEDDHEDNHEDYDEHVWTSPVNAALIAAEISARLCAIDAGSASSYAENTAKYLDKLAWLDSEFSRVVNTAKRNMVVFADRFPVRYFTERYGLEYFAAFPGCSAESEASPKTIAFLIDKVNAEGVPVIFKTELSNGKIADTVSEATGARVYAFSSCHNLTKEEFEAGASYISIMESNMTALKEALN